MRAPVLASSRAFERRIDMATEPGQATPDYPGARVLLGELQAFLPDSLAVKDLQDRLSARARTMRSSV